ncbi:MAG: HAD family hydrolase [Alphaproteobacteria bacterium]|uniref:HAD family hydrolase n=1 Tax=Candidatus Nitrobium versatile TaxID=2884831 RepID=A0A953M0J0_9BACT|nr:HAD family hydrolase [Candidatus Nitrobium versatile]
MKKALFFDLYGTLIDVKTDESDPRVYETLARYLAYHSVALSGEELKKAYGEGVEEKLRGSGEAFPDIDVYELFSSILHRFGTTAYPECVVRDTARLFRSLTVRHFGLFEGVHEVLTRLAEKYAVALVSDAQWTFTEPEIAMLGLDRHFSLTVLSSRFGFRKPDTRLFAFAMERLGVSPGGSVYIGDNPARDLVGAKRAGMACVLFRSDCTSFNGFVPDGRFRYYNELEEVLRRIEEGERG